MDATDISKGWCVHPNDVISPLGAERDQRLLKQTVSVLGIWVSLYRMGRCIGREGGEERREGREKREEKGRSTR